MSIQISVPSKIKTAFQKKIPLMSFRNRIALYYTISTSLLIAIVFTGISFLVTRFVYSHYDDELMYEVTETRADMDLKSKNLREVSHVKNFDDDDTDDDGEKIKKGKADVDPEFIQLVDNQGRVIKKSENLSTDFLIFKARESKAVYFNGKVNGTMLRHLQIPLINKAGIQEGYLVVARPLKNAMTVLQDLQLVFLFSFPLIILTLFILTRFIAGKSIKPINNIITTAEKITQTNLNQRIPLPYHEDELHRLSAAINALLDRLQVAFLREQQFTADASHELNTPLSVVKGTLEVLIRKPREIEHYETRVKFCLMELNRMGRLIDKLLVLALYEGNNISPNVENIILPQLIADVTSRMRTVANEKDIVITVSGSENEQIAADHAMLEMIFENILSNAIKYSPADSEITLTIERNGNNISCIIADQGIGIPEKDIPKIFQRFYRVDESRNSKTGGVGVGLSIVKKLADLQKIKVAVKSDSKKGTTFTLTFLTA